MLAAWTDLGWETVIALGLILAVCCFLAVLWSRREWRSRKIRVGVFLEREYRNPPPADEDTAEWPMRED